MGSGAEFADGLFTPLRGPTFDFGNDTLTITWDSATAAQSLITYSFFDVFATIDPISNVTIQSNGGAPAIGVLFDSNSIFFTHGSQAIPAGANVVLAVTFAETPLPAAFPLFATGLGALGLMAWRRKRKAVAA